MNRWTAAAAVLGATLVFAVWQMAKALDLPTSTPIRMDRGGLMEPGRPPQLAGWSRRSGPAVKLLFAGDIMQHANQKEDDFDATYAGLRQLLHQADLTAAGLEFPVNPAAPVGPEFGSTVFNGSERHVQALAHAGFGLLSTANNHQFDQGIEGAESTLRVIGKAGMQAVGTAARGNPVEVRTLLVGGMRIAFTAYTFPPNIYVKPDRSSRLWPRDWPVNELHFADWSGPYREKGLRYFARDIAAARRAGADFVVALVHWGKEWRFQPTEDQRRAGQDMVDSGFDLVVGSHSHVLSPPEVYRGKLIAYSLGNLASDFEPLEARLGGILEVRVGRPAPGNPADVVDFQYHAVLCDRTAPNHAVRVLGSGVNRADDAALNLARQVAGTVAADR